MRGFSFQKVHNCNRHRLVRPVSTLSRVYWVEPKLVAEITYLSWTGDGLLRHTVFVGLRSDKPAIEVQQES